MSVFRKKVCQLQIKGGRYGAKRSADMLPGVAVGMREYLKTARETH